MRKNAVWFQAISEVLFIAKKTSRQKYIMTLQIWVYTTAPYKAITCVRKIALVTHFNAEYLEKQQITTYKKLYRLLTSRKDE